MEVVSAFQNILSEFGKEWTGLSGVENVTTAREQVQQLINSGGNMIFCGHESFVDFMSTEVSEAQHDTQLFLDNSIDPYQKEQKQYRKQEL